MLESMRENSNGGVEEILETIKEASQILSERTGDREVLREILEVLEKKLRMLRGTIMLVSADGSELGLEAVHAATPVVSGDARYRKGEGVTGLVLEKGIPSIIPDIASESRFQNRIYKNRPKESGPLSFICVPVKIGREILGTLSVDVESKPMEVLRCYSRLLEIIASLISADIKARRIRRIEKEILEKENRRLHLALKDISGPEKILGKSKSMQEVYTRIHQVAASDTTVVIRGGSGTGKEMIAGAIHFMSNRAKGPFLKVNCASLNENLLESELFGHEKGAFTGAQFQRKGIIEESENGTLFLDEIGDMPLSLQVKMLRVLQEKEFQRMGSAKVIKANVRFITATHRPLEQMIREGSFRQDLFYRIHVFPIHVPSLGERREDILLLADHFIKKFSLKNSKDVRRISTAAIESLLAYHWPGNVRELENAIEFAVLVADGHVLHAHHLPPSIQMPDKTAEKSEIMDLKNRVRVMEKDLIIDALKRSRGNVSAAGRELGLGERVVRYKISQLDINIRQFCPWNDSTEQSRK